jgi:hypothetical protein
MTVQQQTIVTCLRMNAATGRTEGIRENATEQLESFLAGLARKNRKDRPSPFSRFLGRLDEKCPSVGATEQDHE